MVNQKLRKTQKNSAKEALDYLENNELTQKEHLRLLGILTKSIGYFPIGDAIKMTPDGGLFSNGRVLTIEEVIKFRQGIQALQENWAFQLLGDQILFESIQHGVHFGDSTDKLMFSKTAVFFITKFRQLLAQLAL